MEEVSAQNSQFACLIVFCDAKKMTILVPQPKVYLGDQEN